MLTTIAIITVVGLACFALLMFAASCGDLSNRMDTLVESQRLLSQSQVELAGAVSDVISLVNNLSADRDEMACEVQRLSKAVQQQAITSLKRQLIGLCAGDGKAARKRYELERDADPGKCDEWYFKQAIASITSISAVK